MARRKLVVTPNSSEADIERYRQRQFNYMDETAFHAARKADPENNKHPEHSYHGSAKSLRDAAQLYDQINEVKYHIEFLTDKLKIVCNKIDASLTNMGDTLQNTQVTRLTETRDGMRGLIEYAENMEIIARAEKRSREDAAEAEEENPRPTRARRTESSDEVLKVEEIEQIL